MTLRTSFAKVEAFMLGASVADGGPKTGRQGVVWAERWRTLRALTISGIELTLEAAGSGVLPPYQGALPRSVLGAALRKAFCSFLDRQCEDCALEADCVSWQVFCTPLPNGLGLGDSFAPHLFVISPGGYGKSQYERGDRIDFVADAGWSGDWPSAVLSAMQVACAEGLGKGRKDCWKACNGEREASGWWASTDLPARGKKSRWAACLEN